MYLSIIQNHFYSFIYFLDRTDNLNKHFLKKAIRSLLYNVLRRLGSQIIHTVLMP